MLERLRGNSTRLWEKAGMSGFNVDEHTPFVPTYLA